MVGTVVRDAVVYSMLCPRCWQMYRVIVYGRQEYELCPKCGHIEEFHEFALAKGDDNVLGE